MKPYQWRHDSTKTFTIRRNYVSLYVEHNFKSILYIRVVDALWEEGIANTLLKLFIRITLTSRETWFYSWTNFVKGIPWWSVAVRDGPACKNCGVCWRPRCCGLGTNSLLTYGAVSLRYWKNFYDDYRHGLNSIWSKNRICKVCEKATMVLYELYSFTPNVGLERKKEKAFGSSLHNHSIVGASYLRRDIRTQWKGWTTP